MANNDHSLPSRCQLASWKCVKIELPSQCANVLFTPVWKALGVNWYTSALVQPHSGHFRMEKQRAQSHTFNLLKVMQYKVDIFCRQVGGEFVSQVVVVVLVVADV